MNNKEIIDSLKRKRDQFQKKIRSIDETIELYEFETNNNGSDKTNISDDYKKSWTHKEKIEFFFKREKRFLYNREIASFAHEKEPDKSIEDFSVKFSNVLSRLKDERQLINKKIGKTLRSTVWGSAKWLDPTGNIQTEYRPSEKYNADKEKKKLEI